MQSTDDSQKFGEDRQISTPDLNIKGKKISEMRPRTSPFKTSFQRDGAESPDSVTGTFTIFEGRTERQTKLKMESLERRLRANEKARKDVEAEVEKWKDRATKNSKRLPELEIELSEMEQTKDEWVAKSQELEVQNKQLLEEKESLETKLNEIEEQMKMLAVKFGTLNDEHNQPIFELQDIEKEISKYHSKNLGIEEENLKLKEQLAEITNRLTENQNHVSTLMSHLEDNKEKSRQVQGICKKELEIRHEQEIRVNHDITIANSTIKEQKLEIEMLRSEIRCLRSYSQEMATSNRNNIILLKSAENERKNMLETMVVMLNTDVEPTETNIKKAIRDLVRERNGEQTRRLEAEKKAESAEGLLLDQAKQHRNALFRARTSEEEHSKLLEKIDELEQELLASDLERKNLEHRLETLDRCVAKVSQMLDVNVGTVYDAIFERIEQLVTQETVYKVIVNENRIISDTIVRGSQKQESEKVKTKTSASAAAKIIQERTHTLKTIDKMDKLNKDLLATMTIETLRAADLEKSNLKKKMNEQEHRIRQLEREKKEGERIRTIIAKWEKRNSAARKTPSNDPLRPRSQASSQI